MKTEINGTPTTLDNDGFLSDPSQWDPSVASAMAALDAVALTRDHWRVIEFLRDYYATYQLAPDDRLLRRALGKTLSGFKGRKEELARLFPWSPSPASAACRYAGLPSPVRSGCC